MLTKLDTVKDAVIIKVGKGRGFIIEAGNYRLIITCGHCLGRRLPPCHGASKPLERMYANLLGRIGKKPTCGPSVFSSIQSPISHCWGNLIKLYWRKSSI